MSMFLSTFVRLLMGALVIGSTYGLIGLGSSLIYRASGLMNFAQGDLFMLGSFVGLTFYKILKLPFAISIILTAIVMFFLGFGIEKAIIRNVLRKQSNSIFVVLATIALSIFFRNLAMLIWGSSRIEFPTLFKNLNSVNISGIDFQSEQLMVILVALFCMVLIHLFLKKSKFGTAMRAAAQDPFAAQACGIDVSLTTGFTWGIAAIVASVGGMLYGPVYGVSISIGTAIGVRAFSGAVIGGYGNMLGAVIGGLLLGITETFAAGYISSEFKDFIAYGMLLLMLFVRPTGIFNERALQE